MTAPLDEKPFPSHRFDGAKEVPSRTTDSSATALPDGLLAELRARRAVNMAWPDEALIAIQAEINLCLKAATALSQAQSALAAMGEKLAIAERNRDAARDNFHTMQQTAAKLAEKLETAEAKVQRLTEEKEALRVGGIDRHLCGHAKPQTYTGAVSLVAPPHMAEAYTRGVTVDVCLALEITKLWAEGITTTGCCCGHGSHPAYIGVIDADIPRMKSLGYAVAPNPMRPGDEDSFVPKTVLDAQPNWHSTGQGDLSSAIAEFKAALPGWWYSVCECQVSCDASCAPTVESEHIGLIQTSGDPFDAGFHADLPQPSTLAEALRNVMRQALEEIASRQVLSGSKE